MASRGNAKRRFRRPAIAAAGAAALLLLVAGTAASGMRMPAGAAPESTDSLVLTDLADGFVVAGRGTQQIAIPAASGEFTVLHVVFDCTSAGLFTWRTGGEAGRALGCPASDTEGAVSGSIDDFDIGTDRTLYIAAPEASTWNVIARFFGGQRTPKGINASGQTYGAIGQEGGTPELVAVTGLDQEGRQVDGYALWAEVEALPPSSPEEALRRRAEDRARYPNGKEIAIYKADGETRVGTFTVGVG